MLTHEEKNLFAQSKRTLKELTKMHQAANRHFNKGETSRGSHQGIHGKPPKASPQQMSIRDICKEMISQLSFHKDYIKWSLWRGIKFTPKEEVSRKFYQTCSPSVGIKPRPMLKVIRDFPKGIPQCSWCRRRGHTITQCPQLVTVAKGEASSDRPQIEPNVITPTSLLSTTRKTTPRTKHA
ncbi:hypothetical protein NE237_008113 [Protea cynaroides]|uniref:Uncharacterized protein n=1 Tax=Protea cynaroides TaxID=273540 RepID=A0A9Q0QX42_9MAGN|nr:hypothetical protein NE237_008113 [Protea cynaroides]